MLVIHVEQRPPSYIPISPDGSHGIAWGMDNLPAQDFGIKKLRQSGLIKTTRDGRDFIFLPSLNRVQPQSGHSATGALVILGFMAGGIVLLWQYLGDKIPRTLKGVLDVLIPDTWAGVPFKWALNGLLQAMKDFFKVSLTADLAGAAAVAKESDCTLVTERPLLLGAVLGLSSGCLGFGLGVFLSRKSIDSMAGFFLEEVSKMSNDQDRLEKEKKNTEQSLKECEKMLTKRNKELDDLLKKKNLTEDHNRQLEEQKKQLDTALRSSAVTIRELERDLKGQNDKISELEHKARAEQQGYKDLKKRYDEKVLESKTLHRGFSDAEKERESLKDGLAKEEGARKKFQTELRRAERNRNDDARTISELERQQEYLREDMHTCGEELRRKKEELETNRNLNTFFLCLCFCFACFFLPVPFRFADRTELPTFLHVKL